MTDLQRIRDSFSGSSGEIDLVSEQSVTAQGDH